MLRSTPSRREGLGDGGDTLWCIAETTPIGEGACPDPSAGDGPRVSATNRRAGGEGPSRGKLRRIGQSPRRRRCGNRTRGSETGEAAVGRRFAVVQGVLSHHAISARRRGGTPREKRRINSLSSSLNVRIAKMTIVYASTLTIAGSGKISRVVANRHQHCRRPKQAAHDAADGQDHRSVRGRSSPPTTTITVLGHDVRTSRRPWRRCGSGCSNQETVTMSSGIDIWPSPPPSGSSRTSLVRSPEQGGEQDRDDTTG